MPPAAGHGTGTGDDSVRAVGGSSLYLKFLKTLLTGRARSLAENEAVLGKRSQTRGETVEEQSLGASCGAFRAACPALGAGAPFRPQPHLPSSFSELSNAHVLLPGLGEERGAPRRGLAAARLQLSLEMVWEL